MSKGAPWSWGAQPEGVEGWLRWGRGRELLRVLLPQGLPIITITLLPLRLSMRPP